MSSSSSNLWQRTRGYGATGQKLGYLTDAQNIRLERIRVARMLWRGGCYHRQAFLEENRSQFNFKEVEVQGRVVKPYVTFNVLRLITTTITDLLLGAEPLLRIEGEVQQAALNELVQRSNLHRVFYDAVKEASWAAEGMVEICRCDGQVYVKEVPPGELFPLGRRKPDGQYDQYRRFATETIEAGAGGKVKLLLETTYSPGLIERQCFRLDDAGRKGEAAPMSSWPVKRDGADLPEKESTGIDAPTIVWMANEMDEGEPTSDYDGLIELQDALNAKQTQIAIVLAQHANPRLAVHVSQADAGGNFPAGHDLFFFHGPDDLPRYVTWDPKLTEAIADRDFALNGLCIAAELSPVLLGIKHGATPDAARKLRLEATKSLARAARKAAFARPFIRAAVDRALTMEQKAQAVSVAIAAGEGSSVELRDGLPVDEIDEANRLATLVGARIMSPERAVEIQLPDPEAQAVELERINAARAEAAAQIQLTGMGFGGREPGEDTDTQPGAQPQEQAA